MAKSGRIVFMGTSEFAATILGALLDAGENVVAAYTRADRPAGRGMRLRASSVKALAREKNIPVLQPENFRSGETISELASFEPDYLVVAAYGLVLPQAVLDIPKIAPVNVHASILPRYRGAAPIQRAIMENWGAGAVTGVSIMRMEKGLDTGPVYFSAELPINNMNSGQLSDELARLGGRLLAERLPALEKTPPVAQDEALATYAPKLAKKEGTIDWRQPAMRADAMIRAVTPWPGARTNFIIGGKNISASIASGGIGEKTAAPAGTIYADKGSLAVACADNWYRIERLRPAGKSEMSARDFVNGLRAGCGEIGIAGE